MEADEGAASMQRALAGELRRFTIWLFVLLTAILLVTPRALAQDGNTSLDGIVEDLSGARIAHAAVSLLNPDNGFHAAVSADGEGRFSFPMLVPGSYTVTASVAWHGRCHASGAGAACRRVDAIAIPASPGWARGNNHGGGAADDSRSRQRRSFAGHRRTGHSRPAAQRTPLHRPGAAIAGCDARSARIDLGLQRRSFVRRDARLPEQLPGGRRRQ